jgi:hypothetical protein
MLLFSAVVSVVFAFTSFFSSVVLAANCNINPLLIPLHLRNNTNGVLFRLNDQDFDLGVSIIQNVTVVNTTLPNRTDIHFSDTFKEAVGLPDLGFGLKNYKYRIWGNYQNTSVIGIGLVYYSAMLLLRGFMVTDCCV